MTPTERRGLIEAVHASPHRLVLAVAGGGNAVITDLLDVPGASRTVLEATVPYAERSLAELIDGERPQPPHEPAEPPGAVSAPTAEAMAAACLRRARHLAGTEPQIERGRSGPVFGVGCTAALVSDRPKKGDHRAHIAVADETGIRTSTVTMDKGLLDRPGEDRVVADAVLAAIAAACGLGERGEPGEQGEQGEQGGRS